MFPSKMECCSRCQQCFEQSKLGLLANQTEVNCPVSIATPRISPLFVAFSFSSCVSVSLSFRSASLWSNCHLLLHSRLPKTIDFGKSNVAASQWSTPPSRRNQKGEWIAAGLDKQNVLGNPCRMLVASLPRRPRTKRCATPRIRWRRSSRPG